MHSFKDIHIGQLLSKAVTESGIEISRICNFIKCSEEDINNMFQSASIDTETLLRWSKLLEYDFFRMYSQHLILYAPSSTAIYKTKKEIKSALPIFRKNLYTKEVIAFILDQIETGNKTRLQVIEDYKIPRTTLHKWISKYKK